MDVSVFYRGAMKKLVRITATDVESHTQAIEMVTEEFGKDAFFTPPVLVLIEGGLK